jgi:hypothetical protein
MPRANICQDTKFTTASEKEFNAEEQKTQRKKNYHRAHRAHREKNRMDRDTHQVQEIKS